MKNILSLFDGISGAQIALERAGIKYDNYYASETDKYAMKITQKHYPKTIQLGNVEFVNGSELPDIWLLIGGSPCTSLSCAAGQKESGLTQGQSTLFWEYVRILNEVKPKYFLLENVASMKKADRETITKVMGVEPILINSSLLSAQQRKRLYWTNIEGIEQPEDKHIYLKDVLEDNANSTYSIYNKKLSIDKSTTVGANTGIINCKSSQVAFTKPVRLGQIGKGGQGDRVYSIDGKSICLSANGGGQGAKTGLYEIKSYIRKLTPLECEKLQTLPPEYTAGISNTQRYKAIGNGFTVDVVAHILKYIKE